MKSTSHTWRWTLSALALAAIAVLLLHQRPQRLSRLKAWLNQDAGGTAARLTGPLWKARLYTPTLLTKIGSLYFIVDCWHNRVLYSPKLDAPIQDWRTLDGDLAGPHSIDADAVLYVVDDTGRNGIRVYTHHGDAFQPVQQIGALGTRTHRVRYDPATLAFYVLASDSQQMTKLVRQGERLHVVYQKNLPFLHGRYTRSFVILDGFMYFNSGPGRITQVKYTDDSYQPIDTFAVPPSVQQMNDLFRSGPYLYLTATPNAMLRAPSLQALRQGQWENVYATLKLSGTPYYLSEFDGHIFVPQGATSSIQTFTDRNGSITDLHPLIDSGPTTLLDRIVRNSLPK